MNHRLQDVSEHLMRHSLFINNLEPATICCFCHFSPSGSHSTVANHLAEKHNVPKSTTKGARRLLRFYTFLGLEDLRVTV